MPRDTTSKIVMVSSAKSFADYCDFKEWMVQARAVVPSFVTWARFKADS
jgi:hypothetical protein